MERELLALVHDLMRPVAHLERVQDSHLEFVLLRYCVCTKPMHLLRMVSPRVHDAAGSIKFLTNLIRTEMGRITGGDLNNIMWEQAQQPTRDMGLGLQNYSLIAGGAYVASQGSGALLRQRRAACRPWRAPLCA